MWGKNELKLFQDEEPRWGQGESEMSFWLIKTMLLLI